MSPDKTYYYRAIIEEYDESQGKYVDRISSVIKSFKTLPIGGDTGTTIAAFGKGWAELPLATTNSSLTENETQCVKYITDMAKQSNGSYHRNYSFCYDTQHYVAMWVAYPMHQFYTNGSNDSETFYADPSFTSEQQLGGTYNSSTYNRGHQIAKAQRKVSALARKQTNYYTNMTPQDGTLNGSQWAQLEGKERGAWMCSDTLYVVSGCYFENYDTKVTSNASGDSKVYPVPTHYFKVMLRTKEGNTGKKVQDCSANDLICGGYWVENKSTATPQLMTVQSIEQKTGLSFFVNVPNAPKSTVNASDW